MALYLVKHKHNFSLFYLLFIYFCTTGHL